MEEKSFKINFVGNTYPAHYIKTENWADIVIHKLMEKNCLFGLDTETCAKPGFEKYSVAALSPLTGRIRLLQIFDNEESYLFDFNHIKNIDLIFGDFLTSKRFIAHNAIFDLGFLIDLGFKNINMGCTLLAARLLMHEKYHNDMGLSASLKALVKIIYKEDILKELQDSSWGNEELTFEQIEYAAIDPICVSKIGEKIAVALQKKGLTKIYSLYKKVQHPVCEMERNGINFDIEAHKALMGKWRENLFKSRKKVLEYTGLKEITGYKLASWLDTVLTPEQKEIWPKTSKGGKLSTAKDTWEEYGHFEVTKPIQEFSKAETLLSTFGSKLVNYISPATGKLHPRYAIAGARTGRMSCNNPNIQNQPNFPEFRNLYRATPGYVFIRNDYSQIEVRVAAEITGDENMKSIYRNGQDIYRITAASVLGKEPSEVTKEERQQQKAVILGRLFGLGAKTFVHYAKVNYGVTVDEATAQAFIEGFKRSYPTFTQWQYIQGKDGERTLKAKTVFGKLRALNPKTFYGEALNTPVQGTAAEIILCSLCNFYDIEEYREDSSLARLILCVHDENVVEAREDVAQKVQKDLIDCMVNAYREVFPYGIVNNLVDSKIGKTWGECK